MFDSTSAALDLRLTLRLLGSSELLASYLGVEIQQVVEWAAGKVGMPAGVHECVRQLLMMERSELARGLYVSPEELAHRARRPET